MCVCVCKCNVCECYSAVLVIRLTYTSTKTCIKTEWHDYSEYIYPLSISKLREGYAPSKCFSLLNEFPYSYCLPASPILTVQIENGKTAGNPWRENPTYGAVASSTLLGQLVADQLAVGRRLLLDCGGAEKRWSGLCEEQTL